MLFEFIQLNHNNCSFSTTKGIYLVNSCAQNISISDLMYTVFEKILEPLTKSMITLTVVETFLFSS